jgi:isoquinoline 1-oxidoreductase beta subunit
MLMPGIARRHVLLAGLGAAGALVVGWSLLPARSRLTGAAALRTQGSQVAMNGWVKISADEAITVVVSQAEMGQGVHTGLAMLLAEEIDADWDQVRVEQSTLDAIYNNQTAILDALPFAPGDHGFARRAITHIAEKIVREIPGLLVTGGSSSLRDQWRPLREAGAAARAMLLAAAADAWQLPAAACRTDSGQVWHPSGRRASYGELAPRAARLAVPSRIELKDPSRYRLIGKPLRRIDSAPKIDGSAQFSLDARPDGLLYARMVMCPTQGGKVARFDARVAQQAPGVRQIVALPPIPGGLGTVGTTAGAVAVIADRPFEAIQALAQIQVDWDPGAAAAVSSAGIHAQLQRALGQPGAKVHFEHGDAAAALAAASRRIRADYAVPFLAHAPMEPLNCTAQFRDGKCTLWAASQSPGLARRAVAKQLGIDADQIELRVPFLGGGFGRRNASDFIVQAALLARAARGAPVQLAWSREQDIAHDYFRPAFAARCEAGLDARGRLVAWTLTSAGSSMGAPGFMDGVTQGASDTAYAWPAARIAHQTVESAVSMGIWRSVAHSQNAFFTECFLDEVAAAAGSDPVGFRSALLGGEARHLRVLRRAAELAEWQSAPPPAPDGAKQARGIALHRSFGTVVAQIAEVSVSADRRIRVHRVVCVVDCGIAVNPNLVRQQMESAIVFGLSAALHGEITIEGGQVQQSNFDDYAPLRIDECPRIETEILASKEAPGGIGEPGTPPIAPAVANAVFALTGERLRALPLRLGVASATETKPAAAAVS